MLFSVHMHAETRWAPSLFLGLTVQVTQLTPHQFLAVVNMEYLGVPVFKRHAKAVSKFFTRKRKGNVREVHLPQLRPRTHTRTRARQARVCLRCHALELHDRHYTPHGLHH